MKRVVMIILAAAMMFSFAGCMRQNPNLVQPTELVLPSDEVVSEGEEPKELEVKNPSDYDNNLEGLAKYLADSYVVVGEPQKMSYEAIGGIGGEKYTIKFDGRNGSVEIYEFNLDELNELATECLDSIKKNGYFVMLDKEVPAELSDNGKYIMVYTIEEATDKIKEQKERSIELFKGFYA